MRSAVRGPTPGNRSSSLCEASFILILALREAKSRFYKIEDLLEVKGIGEKKLEHISKYIDVR